MSELDKAIIDAIESGKCTFDNKNIQINILDKIVIYFFRGSWVLRELLEKATVEEVVVEEASDIIIDNDEAVKCIDIFSRKSIAENETRIANKIQKAMQIGDKER